MKKLLKNWGLLIILVLVAAALPFILTSTSAPSLPEKLASLTLAKSSTGAEADSVVNRLHGRDVTGEVNVVGMYIGKDQSATLYLTEFDTDGEAESLEAKMGEAIGNGDFGFNHLHRMDFKGEPVSACIGHGQIHFFFADGRRLYWLSADYPVAVEAVNDLLESRGR